MNEMKEWMRNLQHLCSRKEYCPAEIMEKLRKSNLSDEQKKDILDHLIEEGYVDERRYARSFVHDKIMLNRWGKQKVRFALYQKKINEQFIEEALSEIDDEDYIKLFVSLASSKWKSLKDNDELKKKNKWKQFLLQRGLEHDVIEKLFRLIK